MAPGGPAGAGSIADPVVRRWLHDKYERLAAQEGDLAANRTSYFAAIGTVLITGLIVALNYFGGSRHTLVLVTASLSALGILISFVWTVLLHRTLDAQAMWRELAGQLERLAPPIDGELPGQVTLRSGGRLDVDLLRPFLAHAQRFSTDPSISWMDRVRPGALSEVLPVAFLAMWSAVLVGSLIFLPV